MGIAWHSGGCSLSSCLPLTLCEQRCFSCGLGHLAPGSPHGFHRVVHWKLWVNVFVLLLLLGFQYFHSVLDPLLELCHMLSSWVQWTFPGFARKSSFLGGGLICCSASIRLPNLHSCCIFWRLSYLCTTIYSVTSAGNVWSLGSIGMSRWGWWGKWLWVSFFDIRVHSFINYFLDF